MSLEEMKKNLPSVSDPLNVFVFVYLFRYFSAIKEMHVLCMSTIVNLTEVC